MRAPEAALSLQLLDEPQRTPVVGCVMNSIAWYPNASTSNQVRGALKNQVLASLGAARVSQKIAEELWPVVGLQVVLRSGYTGGLKGLNGPAMSKPTALSQWLCEELNAVGVTHPHLLVAQNAWVRADGTQSSLLEAFVSEGCCPDFRLLSPDAAKWLANGFSSDLGSKIGTGIQFATKLEPAVFMVGLQERAGMELSMLDVLARREVLERLVYACTNNTHIGLSALELLGRLAQRGRVAWAEDEGAARGIRPDALAMFGAFVRGAIDHASAQKDFRRCAADVAGLLARLLNFDERVGAERLWDASAAEIAHRSGQPGWGQDSLSLVSPVRGMSHCLVDSLLEVARGAGALTAERLDELAFAFTVGGAAAPEVAPRFAELRMSLNIETARASGPGPQAGASRRRLAL